MENEIQAKIDKFQKLLDDKRSTADEKARYEKAIAKLKEQMPKAEKKEPIVAKKKEEAPAKKKEEAPAKKKEEAPAKKKEEAPASKKKGVHVISTKRVSVDGKEIEVGSKEFCDYLLSEWKKRREKAKASKDKKKKTKSVMSKVSANIEKGISQAIKAGIKEKHAEIKKNPKQFINKVEKLETATKNYLHSLKDVMGSEYDGKEVTSTIKSIQDTIDELKKKLKK
jgi:hypothetical protein